MRLIDADALIEQLAQYKLEYGEEEFPYNLVHDAFIYEIDREPTVDAVPVEWIKMRIKGLRGQLATADEDDKDLIWDLRTKIDELSGIAEYWRKQHETD